MKRIIILLIVVLGIVVWLALNYGGKPYIVTKTAEPTSQPRTLSSDKLWQIIQNWRTSQNLPEYIKDDRLCVIAKDRADDGDDDHKGFIRKIESNYYGFTAGYTFQENAIFFSIDEQAALYGWLHSPKHLATLKANYKYSCVATYKQDAVQIFSNF